MVNYRYYTVDILTNNKVMEVPQYDVSCSKQLSSVGTYTGFLKLDTGIYNDDLLLDGTTPGRYAMVVERDGDVIWSGPILSRAWDVQAKTLQIDASTYEVLFERTVMSNDCIYQGLNPTDIITDWFPKFVVDVGFSNSPAFTSADIQAAPGGTTTRTVLIPAYEYHYHSDLLSQIAGTDGGIDYFIYNSGSSLRFKFLYTNTPATSSGFLEFPGNVSRYWATESVARMAMTDIALGAGAGNQLMKSITSINFISGWPNWTTVESYPDIGDQATLDMKVKSMAKKSKPPVYDLTVELGAEHNFAQWTDLGAKLSMFVRDPRFPSGQQFDYVLTGWSLTPESKNNAESVNVTLQDLAA